MAAPSPPHIENPRRRVIFEYIIERMTATAGQPPTVREIVAGCGIPQTSVYHHLDALKDDGFITMKPGVSRGIGVPDSVWLPPWKRPDDDEYTDDWARHFTRQPERVR